MREHEDHEWDSGAEPDEAGVGSPDPGPATDSDDEVADVLYGEPSVPLPPPDDDVPEEDDDS